MIIQFTVDESLPLPARNLLNLVQTALKIKRHTAKELIHQGSVSARGKVLVQPHIMIAAGTCLDIDYVPQPAASARKKESGKDSFEILHDDASIIVVNKPAHLLTVPTPRREGNTLQGQIRTWLARCQPETMALCVHRLDRGVSGLLVFAKSYEVADQLRSQFADRKPDRKYIAIVQGRLKAAGGTFRSYLATDESLGRYSVGDEKTGELAITHYELMEQWSDAALVSVTLETGRRNQIRVHFAEANHPVLGDPRYRAQQATHRWWPYKRLALHAESLGFDHPADGRHLQFTSSWPQEFRDFRRRAVKPSSDKLSGG